ncbi:hypothetical protein Tco_0914194 [Tanacetum coccineum]
MSSSTATYTSVYTDSEPWRFHWSPIEDQPLPDDASPTALSTGYVADSDPEEDPEEEPKEDPTDYPTDRGDDDDDSSDDDEEEEQEASEDDDDEEEEHSVSADSSVVPIDDLVPSAEDTKAFDLKPEKKNLLSIFELRSYNRLLIRLAATEIPSPPLPVPSPPLPLPLPPTHTSPTYNEAPLGYKAAKIRLRAASPPTYHSSEIPSPPLLLPSTSNRDDLPEADMPLRKRAHFTNPIGRFEVGESSAAVAAKQPGLDVATMDATPGRPISREVGYGIEDVWDDMVGDIEERAPTMEALSQRVTDLSTTLARDTREIHVRLKDAQDDKALQRGRVNTLFRDRQYHLCTAILVESEARCARQAWGQAMDCNKAVHAEIQAYRAQVQTHKIQIRTRDTRSGSLETLL